MAVKVRLPQTLARRGLGGTILRWGLVCAGALAVLFCIVAAYYYYRYQAIVDERLKQPLFATTAKIYAAPREVRPGQKLTPSGIVNELRSAGYTPEGAAQPSPLGAYLQSGESVSIRPGP